VRTGQDARRKTPRWRRSSAETSAADEFPGAQIGASLGRAPSRSDPFEFVELPIERSLIRDFLISSGAEMKKAHALWSGLEFDCARRDLLRTSLCSAPVGATEARHCDFDVQNCSWQFCRTPDRDIAIRQFSYLLRQRMRPERLLRTSLCSARTGATEVRHCDFDVQNCSWQFCRTPDQAQLDSGLLNLVGR